MPGQDAVLTLPAPARLHALHAGLFVSRGRGTHETRVIDSHELILVRSGVLRMRERERRFAVAAGEALVLHAGREHGGTAPYDADVSFYWLHFRLEAGGTPDVPLPQHTAVVRPDVLAGYLLRYLDDQATGVITPASASLLVELMLHEVAASPAPSPDSARAGAVLAARALTWIRTRFHQPISTLDVARALGCNADYLGRAFRAAHRRTVLDAIQDERLAAARRLLLQTTWDAERIAREAGFSEAGYFRRVFRRRHGTTPLGFRRQHARMHVNTE